MPTVPLPLYSNYSGRRCFAAATTRNPSSSRPPTRYPSHPTSRSLNHSLKPQLHRPLIANDRSLNQAVYFEGFPANWNVAVLSKVLLRYGIVGSTSIARKKNIRKLHFGFLRPQQNISIAMAIKRINIIEIGSRKLKASLARYPNKRSVTEQPILGKQSLKSNRIFIPSKRDHRSYAVVTSTDKPGDNQPLCFKYENSSGGLSWSKFACVIKAAYIDIILKLEGILKKRNFAVNFAAPAGGLLAIVGFLSNDALNGFLENDWTHLSDSVSEVKPFDSKFANSECLVWLDFTGIPLSLLEENYIKSLVSHFGTWVSCDFDFEQPGRVDIVSCLASVPIQLEGCSFNVSVNSSLFKVHMSIKQSTACSNCDSQLSNSSLGNSKHHSKSPIYSDVSSSTKSNNNFSHQNCVDVGSTTNHKISRCATPSCLPAPESNKTESNQLPSPSVALFPLSSPDKKSNINMNSPIVVPESQNYRPNVSGSKRMKGRSILRNGVLGSAFSISDDSDIHPDINHRNSIIQRNSLQNVVSHSEKEIKEIWKLGKVIGLFKENDKHEVTYRIKELVNPT